MIGRAGRPQFDDFGVAIILCHSDESQKYHALIKGSQTIESHLHNYLVEHINSEIGIGTIHDLESAVRWIKSTFLCIRMEQNPSYYQMVSGSVHGELEAHCHNTIDSLLKNEFIKYDGSGKLVQTDVGSVMSKYYIKYQSMVHITTMKHGSDISEVLWLVCESDEFDNCRFNAGEKQILNDANSHIKYQLDGKVMTSAHKLFVLIQCSLGSVSLGALSHGNRQTAIGLEAEVKRTFPIASRVIKCIMAHCVSKKDGISLVNALELGKSLNVGDWDDPRRPQAIFRQLPKIGLAISNNLCGAGFKTMGELAACEPRRVETICKRNPPFGNELIDAAKRIPNLSLNLAKFEPSPPTGFIEVTVEIVNFSKLELKKNESKNAFSYLSFVAFSKDGQFFDFRRLQLLKLPKNGTRFTLKIPEMLDLVVKVACDSFLGCDKSGDLQLLDSSTFDDSITAILTEKTVAAIPLKQTKIDEFKFKPANPTEMLEDASRNEIRFATKRSSELIAADDNDTSSKTSCCEHKCRDKSSCAHQCCKGVRVGNKRKKSKMNEFLTSVPKVITPYVDELAGESATNSNNMDIENSFFNDDQLPTVEESIRDGPQQIIQSASRNIPNTNLNQMLSTLGNERHLKRSESMFKKYAYSASEKAPSPVKLQKPVMLSPILTPIERMNNVTLPPDMNRHTIDEASIPTIKKFKFDWSKYQSKLGDADADYFVTEAGQENTFQESMIDLTLSYL